LGVYACPHPLSLPDVSPCCLFSQDVTPPQLSDSTQAGSICIWPPNYNYFCWYHTTDDSAAAQFTQGVTDNCDYTSGGAESAAIAARIGNGGQVLQKSLVYASSNDKDVDGEPPHPSA
jgi:hypothetical protein